MKKIKYLLLLFINLTLLTACTENSNGNYVNQSKIEISSQVETDWENQQIDAENIQYNSETYSEDESCNVWVLDVGQGSSMLVEVEGKYMLIDGGDSDKSSYVVSFLKKQNVSNLQYVIATHYDSDHLNGVVGALNVFDVNNVICPEYTATSRVYNSFENIVIEKNVNKIAPVVGETYSLGDAEFTIIAPNSTGYSNVNDYSVGIKFVYHGKSFVVVGDATNESEQEIINNGIDIKADVYVANHHGSSGSNSVAFINKIQPEYAMISAGAGNSYGHPTLQTLNRFVKAGIDIFRTDKQGEIHFALTGSGIKFDKEPYNKLESGDFIEENKNVSDTLGEEESLEIPKSSEEENYILNNNTKKIHKESCNSVSQMKEANKIYFNGTLEEALDDGYEKCKNCF